MNISPVSNFINNNYKTQKTQKLNNFFIPTFKAKDTFEPRGVEGDISQNIDEKTYKYGNKILNNAKNICSSCEELINIGKRNDFQKFSIDEKEVSFYSKNDTLYMVEKKDGNLSRETKINKDNIPVLIQDYSSDNNSSLYLFSKGKLKKYFENVTQNSNGDLFAKEYVEFSTSKRISVYGVDAEISKNGSSKFSKLYNFLNGKLSTLSYEANVTPRGKIYARKIYHRT